MQDYNDQVIRYITIPNILLNTVLTVQEPSSSVEEVVEEESSSEEEDSEEEEDDEDEKRIEEDVNTCDAEAEIPSEKIPVMLKLVSERTRAFVGDWSSLPVSAKRSIKGKFVTEKLKLGTIECRSRKI